jgi:hypothetical protein
MSRKLLAAGLFAPLLLLAIVPAQLALPAEASLNPVPQLTMSFSSTAMTLKPGFATMGFASVGGTISIDKLPGERFAVDLTPTIDTGWGVSISPPTVLLMTGYKVQGFTITVSCYPGTPVNLVGDLRVEARGHGSAFEPRVVGHIAVTVAPFYMVRIDSPNPYKEVIPGSKLSFPVEILNYGNSMDSFDVYIENQQELAGMGWTVSFSTPVVSKVRAGDSKTIRLSVMAPQKSTLYKAEGSIIDVKAVSQNARDEKMLVDMLFPFVVYERGTFIDPFATGWAVFLLVLVVVPMVLIGRRVHRWNKTRPRPAEDEYDDDEYEDGDDGYEDDDDYEDDYEDGDRK